VRKAVASGTNGVGGGILGGVIDLWRLRDCTDVAQRDKVVGVGGPRRRLVVKLRSDREAAILLAIVELLSVLFSGAIYGAGVESEVEKVTGSANRGCSGCCSVICTISEDFERSSPTPDFTATQTSLF